MNVRPLVTVVIAAAMLGGKVIDMFNNAAIQF